MQRISINVQDITGINFIWKNSCAVATTANISLSSIVGSTIDGYVVKSTDRVLVKDQTIPVQNGIYVNNILAVDSDVSYGFGIYYVINGATNGGLFFNGTTGISFSSSHINGTVQSVSLALPSIFTVSGSPITTTGTLTAALSTQLANTVFASPNGSSGAPSFRSIVNNDLTYSSIYTSVGSAGSDINLSANSVALGGSITINVPDAGATTRGVITTSLQTIAGEKIFSSAPSFSTITPGSILFAGSSGLVSQTNNSLFWNANNSFLGIGTNSPSDNLHVVGSARFAGAVKDYNDSAGSAGYILSSTGTGVAWASAYPAAESFSSEPAITSITNYPTFTPAATFTIPALSSGTYCLKWYAEYGTIANGSFATIVGSSSGILASLQNNETSSIAAVIFAPISGFKVISSYIGSETITFNLANANYKVADPATIQRMRLLIKRIG